ncbi:GntR family transcriptional regulator [Stappia sp. P2PMeth1]|uniref:GntR family transcriptional regulator n=1 Tax=Stappia sp. P2PMeth1 TaxID=2003586 RepID=UPI0016487057|nr:GntR family transcriptional regulator [Stappia sp. P2PMeth1]
MARTKAVSGRPGLDEVVAEGVREKILSGTLTTGTHLVEADLGQEFEVSNGTVRSALRHLQNEGLVEFRPRRGMFVAGLSAVDALELCSLRNSLEALAAELAARNLTDEDASRLKKTMEDMRRAVTRRDKRACMEADIAFHRQIVAMSRHKRLIQMYGLLESQIRLFMTLTEPMHSDLFADMIPLHEPIADAVLSGDAAAAAQLSSIHNNPDGKALARHMAAEAPEPEGKALRRAGSRR